MFVVACQKNILTGNHFSLEFFGVLLKFLKSSDEEFMSMSKQLLRVTQHSQFFEGEVVGSENFEAAESELIPFGEVILRPEDVSRLFPIFKIAETMRGYHLNLDRITTAEELQQRIEMYTKPDLKLLVEEFSGEIPKKSA
jgi:hypothetical protein